MTSDLVSVLVFLHPELCKCQWPRSCMWPLACEQSSALSNPACFAQVLVTVLELLLTEHGQLDTAYCCLQPLEQRRQNVLHMLGHHLNHPSNAAITAPLLECAAKSGAPAVRLLRVLCAQLFNDDKYLQQRRIARGAYAEVRLAVK